MRQIATDLTLGQSAQAFGDMIIDPFDVLYGESAASARIMPVCLHTFLAGQPFRAKHLEPAYPNIASHPGVRHATGDEINDWYRAHYL